MKIDIILAYVIGTIGILMIGIGMGYILGTYKINNCKVMTPTNAFKNEECREFYLGR